LYIPKRQNDNSVGICQNVNNIDQIISTCSGYSIKDTNSEVRALIEVNIMPQKDVGFDKIAERIYSFPEVSSCYLISGTYDLLLILEGRDLHTVSRFVAEKLAPLENVKGTVTHFLLKKYKEPLQGLGGMI
jgi:DNA-binding Lrp family transcriptional regulator